MGETAVPRRRLAVSDGAFAAVGSRRVHAGALGSAPWSLPLTDVHALTLLSTELWLVSGNDTSMTRHNLFEGTPIAVPLMLPAHGPGSHLLAAPGDPVAMWHGAEVVEIDGHGGKPTTTAIAGDASVAVPLRAGRWVAIRGWSAQLTDSGVVHWESREVRDAALPVIDGSGLHGGRLVVFALGLGHRRTLIVLDARTGMVRHRYSLQNIADVRFAARHQLAALRSQTGDVVVLDLETGRPRTFSLGQAIVIDAAISPGGRWLAVLESVGGRLQVRGTELSGTSAAWWTIELDELAIDEPATAVTHRAEVIATHVAPEPAPSLEPPAGPAAALDGSERVVAPLEVLPPLDDDRVVVAPPAPRRPVIGSLRPRSAGPRIEPREARTLLELQLRAVASWCELAMAQAFDSELIQVPIEHAVEFVRRLQGVVGGPAQAGERAQIAQRHVRGSMLALHRARKALGSHRLPIDDLAHDFGLSALAGDILLVVAAPVLWGELAEVYAMLGDRNRSSCCELLVCKILGFPPSMRHEIAAELDPWSPLVRAGLILVADDRPRPFASAIPEPLVIDRLRALPVDQQSDSWARPRAATCDLEHLVAPRNASAGLGNAAPRSDQPLRLVVRGRRGSGRRTALAALAAEAGRLLGDIDAAALPGDGRSVAEHLARELRRATIRGWIPCVSNAERIGEDAAERSHIRRALDEHPGPLALRLDSDVSPPLTPGYTLVDLPNLGEGERLAWWRTVLARHPGSTVDDIEALSARYRIGPGVIAEVAAGVVPNGEPVDDRLSGSILQYLDARLGEVAQRVRDLPAWSSLILVPEAEDSLRELISRVRWSRLVFEQWGFAQSAGGSRGIVALFHGLPGTGKTMAAGAIARELGVELYRIDLSRVVSKWIGETERNLASVFAAAEESQAIVLFDEADSLFAKRTEVRSSVDRYANLEVNYILQRLDSFEGIAILTSNHLAAIDPAFRRRLTVEINFPFPDEEAREQLWNVHLPHELPGRQAIDVHGIARRYQLSGGYIRNAALRAAFLAAGEGVIPTHDHVERAVRLQYTQAGKFSAGGTLE